METMIQTALDLGVATLTLPGQQECGDRYVVAPFADGVLVAAVDGIGHGAEAAKAARIAGNILKSRPHETLVPLIRRCHDELRGTRGVVMSVASFNHLEMIMTWAGVGNVEGKLLSRDTLSQPRTLLLSVGTLGYQLGPIYPTAHPIKAGDTLIFSTDGVREDFGQHLNLKQSPQQLADDILARSARHTDDALVLVGRYLG
jgi:hypothetical protein